MGSGKFTLYRDTHCKAGLLFVALLLCAIMVGVLMKTADKACAYADQPQTLGRFVVTPASSQFITVPQDHLIYAIRSGARHCG